MKMRTLVALGALTLVGVTGCADLEVQNPNAPDADRALATPGDVESLIGGSFRNWWNSSSSFNSISPILSVASFQHSAYPANFGMVQYSAFPRPAIINDPANQFYIHFGNPFTWNFRAVAAVVDGLGAIDAGTVTLPADREARAKAFGYFVLGLAHGTVAILYDQGYIYDPSIDRENVELRPYNEVMDAALGYFDQAIQYAQGQNFSIPSSWMSRETSAADLVRISHSMKARYRAAVARTPAERDAVNWNAVIADVDAGVQSTWQMNLDYTNWWSSFVYYSHLLGWSQLNYHVLGMADQSGQYQRWVARAPGDKHPNLSADQQGDPFLIVTPDTRFPQGSTQAQQDANPGTKWIIPTQGPGAQWAQPGRGTWRWSYYRNVEFANWMANDGLFDEISRTEMNLLKAEGLVRSGGSLGDAAAIVNQTRTAAGLNATDASGTNTSCVPRLPNGECGGLLEMLKWEKRVETRFRGLLGVPWYFDGRGWGDLYEGTFLQLPVPGREAELLGIQPYTFGGVGGESAAPVGTYGY